MRILLVTAVVGCAGGDVPPATTEDSGSGPTFTLPGDLVLTQGSTFTFDAEWRIAATEVHAEWNMGVSWSEKTTDAWGTARPPDSYDTLVLIHAATSRDDVMVRLADDDLDAVTLGRWTGAVAGETFAFLADLDGFDPTILVEDGATTWLLLLADEVGPRLDPRDGLILTPKTAQLGTSLTWRDGVAQTTWAAHFGDDELRTDEGHERYTVDWSGLVLDAYGKASDPARVDEVFVGRFDAVDEADDLGGQVLDLQGAASGWWTTAPQGASALLSDARDAGGATFPGFTADTSWLVGGRCTTCFGPAPTWLAVVDVRRP